MAAQQIQIAETIRAMKLALKRRPNDAEDDDEIASHTNRGHKLKRRAQFVREGRLDTTGRLAYRNHVSHAGYMRHTISTNPPLYDEDGEPYSPTSSDNEQERHLVPIEDNAFGEVQLEQLLRPLTAVHELIDHPSLSIAYNSKALAQMAADAMEMLRRERESLWKAKRLLRRFKGEPDWTPCGFLETEGDVTLLHDMVAESGVGSGESSNALQSGQESVIAQQNGDGEPAFATQNGALQTTDVSINGMPAPDMATQSLVAVVDTDALTNSEPEVLLQRDEQEAFTHNSDATMGEHEHVLVTKVNGIDETAYLTAQNPTLDSLRCSAERAASESGSNSGSGKTHRMTTRARARSPQLSPSPSPSPSDSASAIPMVHRWFLAPATSVPDKDLGLPPAEAAETRKVLFLYCQKQEQIVRSLESLHSGLARADRLKGEVYRSAKASEHLGDMSDGEDWYDPEEWKLAAWELKDGGLEKGKDEVEDPAEEEGRRGGRRRRVAGAKAG